MTRSVAILAGGQSRRMGEDKAQMLLGGVPLIDRVATALSTFGPLMVIGGDATVVQLISNPSVTHVDDLYPGEGPLGGVLSALTATDAGSVLVAACDLPRLDAASIGDLIAVGDKNNAEVSVPLIDGRRQWHIALWNQRARRHLETAFASGVRSLHTAAAGLGQTTLVSAKRSSYIDLDTPDDVSEFTIDAATNSD